MKQKIHRIVYADQLKAELITMTEILVTTNALTDEDEWSIQTTTRSLDFRIEKLSEQQYRLLLKEPFPFGDDCYVACSSLRSYVDLKKVVRTDEFDRCFYYTGTDLGASYSKEKTSFAIWSPTATKLQIHLYSSWHSNVKKIYPCWRDRHGVWRLTIEKDLEGVWYTIAARIDQRWRSTVDPYAKFLSINGEKAMIGDGKKVSVQKKEVEKREATDIIIYELHLRDFTIGAQNGIKHKGRYLGLTETGGEY